MSSEMEQYLEIDAPVSTISEKISEAVGRVDLSNIISAVKDTTQRLDEADGVGEYKIAC